MSLRPFRDIHRRKTKVIKVGNVKIGGDNPISVQSMTNTLTKNVKETINQINQIANERADLVIKTEFGLGHYKFLKFSQLNGKLMLEFNLLDDSKYHDTASIYNHIGKTCFLTAEQYLTVYSYLAEA